MRRQGGIVGAYLERLKNEALELFSEYPAALQTLYFGGGTPSFLRDGELVELRQALPWDLRGAEVTMEANPGTLNTSRLELLRDLGVNRLSLGVQSFDDKVLKSLGRAHGKKGALKAVEMSLEAGFRTSVDLILGLPEQDFATDLETAANLGVGHISAYTLQIEPGTPFELGKVKLDEDLEATAFEQAEEIFGSTGFTRYEISNFAKPGEESRHNLLYWQGNSWGGLGPAAAGQYSTQLGAIRKTNPPLPRWLAGELPQTEEISPLERFRESLMMGLRLKVGVSLNKLEQQTGLEVSEVLEPTIHELENEGLILIEGTNLKATARGRQVLHSVILRLWEALEPIPYPTK